MKRFVGEGPFCKRVPPPHPLPLKLLFGKSGTGLRLSAPHGIKTAPDQSSLALATQQHSALRLKSGPPPFFACLHLTPWPLLYINLSRYCDEKRKTVKIRCGRATVIGTNPRRATVHRQADKCWECTFTASVYSGDGKVRPRATTNAQGPEARRRLITCRHPAARQYCLAFRQVPGQALARPARAVRHSHAARRYGLHPYCEVAARPAGHAPFQVYKL